MFRDPEEIQLMMRSPGVLIVIAFLITLSAVTITTEWKKKQESRKHDQR